MHEPQEDLLGNLQHVLTTGGVIVGAVSTVMEWGQILFAHAEPNGTLPVIGLWMFGIGCIIGLERKQRSYTKQDP